MITELKPYPELEGSGVDWLGELPAHWQARKLRSLYRRHGSGTTPAGDHYFGGGVPWIMSGDLNDGVLSDTKRTVTQRALHEVRALKIYPAHSLVIAMYGATIGRTGILSVEACTNQACCVLADPTRDANTVYFQLVLNTARPHLVHCSFGGGQPNINAEIVRALRVPVPPLPEQTAIVRFLDHADRRIRRYIRAKQKLIALLQEQKQAIIHQAVTGQIDVRTGQPYPVYKPSGVEWLGDVPAHWEISRVKTEFHCLNHRRVPLSSTERGVMTLRRYDYYGASGVIDKVDHYLFDDELLLVAEDGANLVLRNLPLAIIARGKLWVNNHAHILKPKRGHLEYLAEAMEGLNYLPWISGAAQPKLTQDRLMSIAIAVPPREEQDVIVSYTATETRDLRIATAHAQREINLLHEYRTRLIADVVTGKFDVREAAAALPEADPLAAEDDLDETFAAGDESEFDNEEELAEAAD